MKKMLALLEWDAYIEHTQNKWHSILTLQYYQGFIVLPIRGNLKSQSVSWFLFWERAVADPFIKINKKMLDELLDKFSDRLRPAARSVWLYLLIYANYMDNGKLKRGQIFIGRKSLSDQTLTSERTVRTVIDTLILNDFLAEKTDQQPTSQQQKTDQQPTSRPTNRGTILTIVNYDIWVMSEIQTDQQTDQQPTSQQQKIDQQPTTQEVIKELNEVKEVPPIPPLADPETDSESELSSGSVGGISVECSHLATKLETNLQFHLGTQGWHLKRLESYRQKISDTEIEGVVSRAADWIGQKCRSGPWKGIFGCLDNHLKNPQKDSQHTTPPTNSTPDDPQEGAYQRVIQRARVELGARLCAMGSPKGRKFLGVFRLIDGDKVAQIEKLCAEEGLSVGLELQ